MNINEESPLKVFTWNKIRLALLTLYRHKYQFIGKVLRIDFPYHNYKIALGTSGKGMMTNINKDSRKITFSFIMPKDIQDMVKKIYKTYEDSRSTIPINMRSN